MNKTKLRIKLGTGGGQHRWYHQARFPQLHLLHDRSLMRSRPTYLALSIEEIGSYGLLAAYEEEPTTCYSGSAE
ncbi:hypothetical protein GN244_ATG07999 [Phytophthora infestans]|uniref:Uncharacterized protein n=1 Tax=Phytophthora infestans TaxID=4787 RepID=A0A833TF22_PHYIN|nr:hypothetical protein GN244_ATG07999 [Phytophthora infestans]